jgi:hypothetical protein
MHIFALALSHCKHAYKTVTHVLTDWLQRVTPVTGHAHHEGPRLQGSAGRRAGAGAQKVPQWAGEYSRLYVEPDSDARLWWLTRGKQSDTQVRPLDFPGHTQLSVSS